MMSEQKLSQSIIGVDVNDIKLVPYDPRWPEVFKRDEEMLLRRFWTKNNGLKVHHVGSTAIPTITEAKPVMDILMEMNYTSDFFRVSRYLVDEGFYVQGDTPKMGTRIDYYMTGASQRVFCDDSHQKIRNYLHYDRSCGQWYKRLLLFKKFMLENPQEAQKYVELKKELVQKFPNDYLKIAHGKCEFVENILDKAWERYE